MPSGGTARSTPRVTPAEGLSRARTQRAVQVLRRHAAGEPQGALLCDHGDGGGARSATLRGAARHHRRAGEAAAGGGAHSRGHGSEREGANFRHAVRTRSTRYAQLDVSYQSVEESDASCPPPPYVASMASCTSFLAAPLVSRRAVARGAARSTVCAAAAKPDRPLYYPGAKAPAYLDGSLSAYTETAARAARGVARRTGPYPVLLLKLRPAPGAPMHGRPAAGGQCGTGGAARSAWGARCACGTAGKVQGAVPAPSQPGRSSHGHAPCRACLWHSLLLRHLFSGPIPR